MKNICSINKNTTTFSQFSSKNILKQVILTLENETFPDIIAGIKVSVLP